MIKRFIPLLCVLSIVAMLLVPSLGVAVSAADSSDRVVLDYQRFVTGRRSIDGGDILSVRVRDMYSAVYCKSSSGVSYVRGAVSGKVSFAYEDDCYSAFKLCFPGVSYSEPRYYMSLENIADGAPLHLSSLFYVNPDFLGTYTTRVFYQINYYDEAFKNIAVMPTKPKIAYIYNCSGRYDGFYETDNSVDNAFNVPDGAKYFAISLVVRVEDIVLSDPAASPDTLSFDFGFSDYTLDVTRYDVPFDIGSVSSILGSIGELTVDSVGGFSSVFWDSGAGSFTFLGALAVCALALAVVLLLILVVVRFLWLRG